MKLELLIAVSFMLFLVGFPSVFAQSGTPETNPLTINNILKEMHDFINHVIGTTNIDSSSNPAGISTKSMQDLSNSGYNVAKNTVNLGTAVNNASMTTINDFSPIKIPDWLLWAIGIGITLFIVFGFLRKFWKHAMYFVGIVIAIVIFMMLLAIHAKGV